MNKYDNQNLISDNTKLMNNILQQLEASSILKYTSSVIISGSFGRDEPTYYCDSDGIHYLSDIEMVLVYSNLINMLKLRKLTPQVIQKFSWIELELMPISASRLTHMRNHNYSVLSPKYKTLFTYDFYKGSKTLWGKEYLNQNISITDVDRFEGKRIIANRIAEWAFVSNNNKSETELMRWNAKIILALGTAFLLEKKKYSSSYRKQKQWIVMHRDEVDEFFCNNFVLDYERAFAFLREGNQQEFIGNLDRIRDYTSVMYNHYKQTGINRSRTGCLYITLREAALLVKYNWRLARFCLNPKNLIFDSVMERYISKSPEITQWAQAWKRVLN